MIDIESAIKYRPGPILTGLGWSGDLSRLAYDEGAIQGCLRELERPVYVLKTGRGIGFTCEGSLTGPIHAPGHTAAEMLAVLPPLPTTTWGDPTFKERYGLKYAYLAGSMAQGIASEELVIALGRAGMLASFGAAGLGEARIEAAIRRIQQALPDGPYAFNLIHSPSEEAIERKAVDLYLKYGVRTVEASAFLDLTPHIVYYRAAGLGLDNAGNLQIRNRVIAKISRREVAAKFMQPAPQRLLDSLLESGHITPQQAALAAQVPVADDITVEADSGGHTDNRPLVCLLPSILELRDEIQARYAYPLTIGVGAAGGISTPASALAAFALGAAYIMTGSVNSSCLEAGTSEHTKKLLAEAQMADVIMAPSADMFEMGVKVQLLKRGTLFPMRSQKLYELYKQYNSLEEIPPAELATLEKQIFKRPLGAIWDDTVAYFQERDPDQIRRAADNPKRKMALIFRWYLGLSSRWSNTGEKGREMDYQVWCGPAMGAFNDWVAGTYLQNPANRRAEIIAHEILNGAAYLYRVQSLKLQGLQMPSACSHYRPVQQGSL